MDKWEYRSHWVSHGQEKVDGQKKAVGSWLNELGGQGWELVSAIGGGIDLYRLFFKRRLTG